MTAPTSTDQPNPRHPDAEVEPLHQGTGLTATQFQRAERRAEVRRTRWRDLQLEQESQRDFDEEVATTEQAISTAPGRLDLETFLAEYPHLDTRKARVVADGQMVYLRPGNRRWSLTVGNGRTVVRAVEFRAPGTIHALDKPAGIRAVTELAACWPMFVTARAAPSRGPARSGPGRGAGAARTRSPSPASSPRSSPTGPPATARTTWTPACVANGANG